VSKADTFREPVTDHKVIAGVLAGERRALEQLYSHYFPPIRTMILRNSGTEDEAKDVFQDAVCVLYDKVTSSEGFSLTSQLNTYLYAICRRLWLKELKANSRLTGELGYVEEEASLEMDLALHQEKEEQFERMQSALEKMGEPCRGILTDFYIKNLSMQEISEKFEYTNADNAKNQKYKCLQRLKKLYFNKK